MLWTDRHRGLKQHDGKPEQNPPNFPPPFTRKPAPGNWMVVDIGDGRSVLYAPSRLHSFTAKVASGYDVALESVGWATRVVRARHTCISK
jgi:hypothetical protein